MEASTVSRGELSRRDWMLGVGCSLLIHLAAVLAASLLPVFQGARDGDALQYYSVDLVAGDELSATSPKSASDASSAASSASGASGDDSAPAVPIRKLRVDEPASEPAVKKISPSRAPRLSRRGSASLEKSLDELIPRRKTPPAPSRATSPSDSSPESGRVRGGNRTDLLFRMYLPEVWDAVRRKWVLPETLKEARELEAILIVRVRKDGKILSHRFEKRSGNDLFDKSVVRAVLKADPLPPFPKAYPQDHEEIGVRFRPEDLQ